MQEKLKLFNRYLDAPLSMMSRFSILLAGLILIPIFFTPLWHLEFGSQQYPEGLELFIYSTKLVGGDDGNDLTEINILNHYIGMRELRDEDFTEFKWIPLFIGLLIVISFRSAVVGTLKSVVDVFFIFFYFSLYSVWRFWYMLTNYGHELDPKAAVKVDPFTPPVFGEKMVGQFTVSSFPSFGTYCFALFALLIIAGIYFTYKREKLKTNNLKEGSTS